MMIRNPVLRRIAAVIWAAIAAYFIALFLQVIWSALILANLRTTPAIPWAAPAILILVWLTWRYLSGEWLPARTSEYRRRHLRARSVPMATFLWSLLTGALSIAALAGCWIVMTRIVRMPGNGLPDMSAYPSFTVSALIMTSSLIGPIMEQAGFWGYGQVILEDHFRPWTAIIILSVMFGLGPHPPPGSVLWPRFVFYFLASVSFGLLAFYTRSILPSLATHIAADLVFFTLIWPRDSGRPLIAETGLDLSFWLSVALASASAILAGLAFVRLAKIAQSRSIQKLDWLSRLGL
jgi:membrane protease YdiL (CAAX protease family)